jgi:hypothetical protein
VLLDCLIHGDTVNIQRINGKANTGKQRA